MNSRSKPVNERKTLTMPSRLIETDWPLEAVLQIAATIHRHRTPECTEPIAAHQSANRSTEMNEQQKQTRQRKKNLDYAQPSHRNGLAPRGRASDSSNHSSSSDTRMHRAHCGSSECE